MSDKLTLAEPRDHVEAMLAVQMAAIHMASMKFARRLAHVENIPTRTTPSGPSTSLRTFAAQVAALKDYRSRGEQKMIVRMSTSPRAGRHRRQRPDPRMGCRKSEGTTPPTCTRRQEPHRRGGAGHSAAPRHAEDIASAGCRGQLAGRAGPRRSAQATAA